MAVTLGDPWSPDCLSRSQAADNIHGHSEAQDPRSWQEPPTWHSSPLEVWPLLWVDYRAPRPFGGDSPLGSLSPASLTWHWWLPGLCSLLWVPELSVSQLNRWASLQACVSAPRPLRAAPEHPPCPALFRWPQAAALVSYPWAWPRAPQCCPDLTWVPPPRLQYRHLSAPPQPPPPHSPRPFTASVPGTHSPGGELDACLAALLPQDPPPSRHTLCGLCLCPTSMGPLRGGWGLTHSCTPHVRCRSAPQQGLQALAEGMNE